MKPTAVDAAVIKVIGSMRRSLNRRKYFRVKNMGEGDGRGWRRVVRVYPVKEEGDWGFVRVSTYEDRGSRANSGFI
jgi:hypothetical protein